jgi:RecB family exonuclease
MLAGLPYETFDKKSEGLYHGLVHIIFNYLGIYADSETHSSRGRADAIVQTPDTVYIFEFKFGESAEAAVAQIRERAYADRFRSSGKHMLGIGVSFDAAQRAIGGWVVEEL